MDRIRTRKDLHFFIQEDCRRNEQNRGKMRYILSLLAGSEQAHAFKYLKHLRHEEYHINNKGFFHRIMASYYHFRVGRMGLRYGIYIHPNSCGYGLRLVHLAGGGILLNVNKVGNYCSFNSGTIIGNAGGNKNRPIIGDYVAFGPGAKAFGKIFIGDNVFVAPNAVVTKDVEPNRIVAGVPARVLKETKIEDNIVYQKYHK